MIESGFKKSQSIIRIHNTAFNNWSNLRINCFSLFCSNHDTIHIIIARRMRIRFFPYDPDPSQLIKKRTLIRNENILFIFKLGKHKIRFHKQSFLTWICWFWFTFCLRWKYNYISVVTGRIRTRWNKYRIRQTQNLRIRILIPGYSLPSVVGRTSWRGGSWRTWLPAPLSPAEAS